MLFGLIYDGFNKEDLYYIKLLFGSGSQIGIMSSFTFVDLLLFNYTIIDIMFFFVFMISFFFIFICYNNYSKI